MSTLYQPLFERADQIQENKRFGHARLQQLDQQLIVLTPNQRLALSLSEGYGKWQGEQEISLWQALPSLAFDSWIKTLWQQWHNELSLVAGRHGSDSETGKAAIQISPVTHTVLSPVQELCVWEAIIRESDLGDDLLRPGACAELAMKAHKLLLEWGDAAAQNDNSISTSEGGESEDIHAFKHWRNEFIARCNKAAWLTSADLVIALIAQLDYCKRVSELNFILPSTVFLCGFEEHSALQQRFFAALRHRGIVVDTVEFKRLIAKEIAKETPAVIQFDDQQTEWRAAARWAGGFFSAEEPGSNSNGKGDQKPALNPNNTAVNTAINDPTKNFMAPNLKVAIIVPNLEAVKSELRHVFSAELAPNYLTSLAPVNTRPFFNLSAGDPLTSFPLVATALKLLRWSVQAIELDEAIELLTSVFITGGVHEYAKRSALIPHIFKTGAEKISLERVNQLCASLKTKGQPEAAQFSKIITGLLQWREICEASLAKRQSHSEWLAVFEQVLSHWGWPGDRSLDSDEYQQYQKWQEAFASCADLDVILPKVSYTDALAGLRKVLEKTVFQPKSENQSIFVLGLLEALGQDFDAVWVVGVHSDTLPDKPNPNPFISYPYQVSQSFPRSSSDRELAFALNARDSLVRYYPELIFSWTAQQEGCELKQSSLIAQWPVTLPVVDEEASNKAAALPALSESILENEHSHIEIIRDVFLPVHSNEVIRGGAGLLKAQASCGFKAFAQYRLLAEPHETISTGLTAAQKGELAHGVLEAFWEETQTQERLMSLPRPDIETRLLELSAKVIDALRKGDTPLLTNQTFLRLERYRLLKMALAWLDLELKRSSFEVLAVEQKQSIDIAGLSLNLRIDRIDRLPSGRYLIIDYKTGAASIKDIATESFREPQLPLYCLLDEDKVSAVAFAQLKIDDQKFKGLRSVSENLSPEKEIAAVEEWGALMASWKAQLENLAYDFLNGNAMVRPLDPKKDCQYCPYTGLCRVGEDVDLNSDAVVDAHLALSVEGSV